MLLSSTKTLWNSGWVEFSALHGAKGLDEMVNEKGFQSSDIRKMKEIFVWG